MRCRVLPLDKYFHPVLESAKLRKKPVSIELDARVSSERIVLFRTQSGVVSALADRCPHRSSPLSLGTVNENSLLCPYHGWSVDLDGAVKHPISGRMKNCRVQTYSVHELNGLIWLATRPSAKRASVPSNEWIHVGGFELEIAAPLELVLDNFNEDEHFPYVHKVLGWDRNGAKDVQFSFTPREDSIEVNYRGLQREFWGKSLFLSPKGAFLNNRWTVNFDPVRISYTATTTDKNGLQISPIRQHVVIYFVPHGNGRTVLRVIQYSTLGSEKWNSFVKVLGPVIVRLTKWDLKFDKRLLEAMVKSGMDETAPIRFGEYDQPLFHARKMLRRNYWNDHRFSGQVDGAPELIERPDHPEH